MVLSTASRAPLLRLIAWLALPFRAWRAERLIRRSGGVPLGRYAVFPNIDAPVIAYELRTTAARYVEAQIVVHRQHRLLSAARSVASWVVGCDPAIDSVVVVGRRCAENAE